jgi:hypothetical protein
VRMTASSYSLPDAVNSNTVEGFLQDDDPPIRKNRRSRGGFQDGFPL